MEQTTTDSRSPTPSPFKAATLFRMSQLKRRLQQMASERITSDLRQVNDPTSKPSEILSTTDATPADNSQLIDLTSPERGKQYAPPVIDLVSPDRNSPPLASNNDRSAYRVYDRGFVLGKQHTEGEPSKSPLIHSKTNLPNPNDLSFIDCRTSKDQNEFHSISSESSFIPNHTNRSFIDCRTGKDQDVFSESPLNLSPYSSNEHSNDSFIEHKSSKNQEISNERSFPNLESFSEKSNLHLSSRERKTSIYHDLSSGKSNLESSSNFCKKIKNRRRKKKDKRLHSQCEDRASVEHSKRLKSLSNGSYNACGNSPELTTESFIGEERGENSQDVMTPTTSTTATKKLLLPSVPTEQSTNLLKHNLLKNIKAYQRISGGDLSSTTSLLKPKQSEAEKFISGKLQGLEKSRRVVKQPSKEKDVSPEAVRKFLVAKKLKTTEKVSVKSRGKTTSSTGIKEPLTSPRDQYAGARSLQILEAVKRKPSNVSLSVNHKNGICSVSKSVELKRLLQKVKSPESKRGPGQGAELSSTDDVFSSRNRIDELDNTFMTRNWTDQRKICPISVIPKKGKPQKYYAKRSSKKKISVVAGGDNGKYSVV